MTEPNNKRKSWSVIVDVEWTLVIIYSSSVLACHWYFVNSIKNTKPCLFLLCVFVSWVFVVFVELVGLVAMHVKVSRSCLTGCDGTGPCRDTSDGP